MSGSSSSVIDLRKLLAERFPQSFVPRHARLTTELAPLDEATGGGWPKSAITEITSPHVSAGSASLIHALLGHAQRSHSFLALVDGRDSFDPATAGDARLRHLLWVRCHQASEAVKAGDLLLRDGNFPLVVLDLVLNTPDELRRIPQTNWYRLQRLVEGTSVAFVVLTRRSMISSAQLKLILNNQWRLADLDRDFAPARFQICVERRQGERLSQTA
ncbi:MAG: hypothetical protein ACJ8JD_10560 [Chthoniobacterales bacterium]